MTVRLKVVAAAVALMGVSAAKTLAVASEGHPMPAMKSCKAGEIGGVVKSNVADKHVGWVTTFAGDPTRMRTPAYAKDAVKKIEKLKSGDVYCVADDGA